MQLAIEDKISRDKKEILRFTEQILDLSKDPENASEIKKKIVGIFSLVSTIAYYAKIEKSDIKICELKAAIVNDKMKIDQSFDDCNDDQFWQKSIIPEIESFCLKINMLPFYKKKRLPFQALKVNIGLGAVEWKTSEEAPPSIRKNFIDADTEDAHLLLFSLENELRNFVSSKINENKGFIPESIMKDWVSSKKKEALPPRKPLDCDLINYSSFNQLKTIIVQNENWEKIFKKHFGRPTGVISRLNELDEIRDTFAHNRVLSDFDNDSFKILYNEIMGCIQIKENKSNFLRKCLNRNKG